MGGLRCPRSLRSIHPHTVCVVEESVMYRTGRNRGVTDFGAVGEVELSGLDYIGMLTEPYIATEAISASG